jgi:hypothetical protein
MGLQAASPAPSFQPSEFAKPALILFLAYFVARRAHSMRLTNDAGLLMHGCGRALDGCGHAEPRESGPHLCRGRPGRNDGRSQCPPRPRVLAFVGAHRHALVAVDSLRHLQSGVALGHAAATWNMGVGYRLVPFPRLETASWTAAPDSEIRSIRRRERLRDRASHGFLASKLPCCGISLRGPCPRRGTVARTARPRPCCGRLMRSFT